MIHLSLPLQLTSDPLVIPQSNPDSALAPIPFNKLHTTGRELEYIQQAIAEGSVTGDGNFTKRCQTWLEQHLSARKVLLTHSCTGALEMAALLTDIQPGDEVIMPSFTFVSTANAFVLRGGVPVFVDIRPDTLNLDESLVAATVTKKTKAIVPVHYAGVSSETDILSQIAQTHDLMLIEDAAQALGASYRGQPIGTAGSLSCFSFHATKNIVSGEGGALVISDPNLMERAEILWEKGTNRKQFFRGEIDKYSWVDLGSSYLPSDILAAFLWAQLEELSGITQRRLWIWQRYHQAFTELEQQRQVTRPQIPNHCQHNAHIYYLLVQNAAKRAEVLAFLKSKGVQATFHYVPLHTSPAGQKYCRTAGNLAVTEDISDRLVRLPLSAGMTQEQVDYIISIVQTLLKP